MKMETTMKGKLIRICKEMDSVYITTFQESGLVEGMKVPGKMIKDKELGYNMINSTESNFKDSSLITWLMDREQFIFHNSVQMIEFTRKELLKMDLFMDQEYNMKLMVH